MMTPAKYNQARSKAGHLSYDHLRQMVVSIDLSHADGGVLEHWFWLQFGLDTGVDWEKISTIVELWQAHAGITDDGMFGPASLRRFNQMYTEGLPSDLARVALEVAIECLGRGEEHQNNAGKFLHMLRMWPFDDDYSRPIGNWCEFFVNWCYRQAAERLNVKLPFAVLFHDTDRNKPMPIGSAKALGRRIGEAGQFVKLQDIRPGDIIVWDRGIRGSEAGHIAIVVSVNGSTFTVIEGNFGRFPAVVQYRTVSFALPGRVEFCARI